MILLDAHHKNNVQLALCLNFKLNAMYTILVPTDFSDNADNALNYAIGLAKDQGAELLLVNAYLLPYQVTSSPKTFINDEIKQAELISHHHLKMKCNTISSEDGIKCEYESAFGEPPGVISATIKAKKPALIVMGTHGASGLKAAFIGSNTYKVIVRSKIPLLAIPAEAAYKGINKILFTTDFHKSDIAALKLLLSLVGKHKPHIQITHIYEGEFLKSQQNEFFKYKKMLAEKLGSPDFSFKLLHVQNVLHELGTLSRSRTYDLLVMSTHTRSLVERMMNKSMSKAIVQKTEIPLLVMHHREKAEVVI